MDLTLHHGAILATALKTVLGRPEPGGMAFVRCLTPGVVEALADAEDSFCIPGWTVRRVADVEDAGPRTITAGRAVEMRESKSEAVLLLVDTERAGAGMDGIFSATREVSEKDLFKEANRRAAREITKVRNAEYRQYAEAAVKQARRQYGRYAVSLWSIFDFFCHVATNRRPAGAYVHLLGFWPIKETTGVDAQSGLDESRRFVDQLLAKDVASRSPAERIDGLRLLNPTTDQLNDLERFLRAAATLPIRSALLQLIDREHLWINALQTEGAAEEILSIDLVPWLTKTGKVNKWSGLTEREDDVPALTVNLDAENSTQYTKLEVRWKARPGHLAKGSAEYSIAVVTSRSEVEIASRTQMHAAKAVQKCIFTNDDFVDLPEDAAIPAMVVLSVVGNSSVQSQESEEFQIEFGERPEVSTSVGKQFRTFSEALIDLDDRAEVEEMMSLDATQPRGAKGDSLVWRSPNGRKNFRVYRPPLIKQAEDEWQVADGAIGRWRIKVRISGERVGRPQFVPIDRPLGADQDIWSRVRKANAKMATRFAGFGGVGQLYDDQVPACKSAIAEYLSAWSAILEAGAPLLALAHTVEVQSQSGELIGLIVMPSHPIRLAWHAAYDNLVLHSRYDEKLKPANIRREMAALDGAAFPAFLPGLSAGSSFVFADTLGFHAVGMVTDTDAEPKATLAILHRALVTREDEGSSGTPTVGRHSVKILGSEIYRYLEAHKAARVLHVHALRPGDGKTVVRALGWAAHRNAENNNDAESEEGVANRPVFVLEIHPSEKQSKRGVAGRFIAETQEKRRRGAGTVEEVDRWMLKSVSLPGGVHLPNLRWARKAESQPETAAHIALAFDTFASRVQVADTTTLKRPVYAFGLMAFLERKYSDEPHPSWRGLVPEWEGGESHPRSRAHTDRLRRLQNVLHILVARNLQSEDAGSPMLLTEVSPEVAEKLDRLHGLCDWVITLDRNAGIEYFDSPRNNSATYDKFVIDCVPEREDLGCLQLITSTADLKEVRSLLDFALSRMGLTHSRRNAEFLLANLKALSGRLAIRLTGGTTSESELVALALCQANCKAADEDECWLPLRDGFFIPVDDVQDQLPPVSQMAGKRNSGMRPDLVYVSLSPQGGLSFQFVEVKYRRHLRAARSSKLMEGIRSQTKSLNSRWFDWYGLNAVPRGFRAIRLGKLARVLRFYADKANRHGLRDERHQVLVGQIDRMVERCSRYDLVSVAGGDRGWVFCPEFQGRKPIQISPPEWQDIGVFLLGPASLPDLDWGRFNDGAEEQSSVLIEEPASANQNTVVPIVPTESEAAEKESHADPEHVTSTSGGDSSDTKSPPDSNVKPVGPTAEPSVVLGQDRFSGGDVSWPLTVKGNPHLLVAGLSGMGKTTCLLNLCKQMMASGVSPIVFSFHDDIDEKLKSIGQPVRFIDFDGLGFNPLEVFDRTSKFAHLDVAGTIRDIFGAIYPKLGDLQRGDIRTAVKESFEEAGWGGQRADGSELKEPGFRRFLEILRDQPKPNVGLRNLLERLNELDDYGFFTLNESQGGMWDDSRPTVIRIHRTQSEVMQRAFSFLLFYGLYKSMFKRGIQNRITHAVIMDEAHRAAKLPLIPTMAKECRKYGVSLVLASQEAKDFQSSVFSSIANYLVLRLNEPDAKALVKNVASSNQQSSLLDKIKQMERFKAIYFSESRKRPSHINLPDYSPTVDEG